MKTRWMKLGLLMVSFLWLGIMHDAYAGGPPVAMLTQAKGDVQVSKNGTKWKKVRRNKFLFAGYQIKTGPNGSGKLVNQATNLTRRIGANSLVTITASDAKAISGMLSDAQQDSGNLVSGLGQRFAKAQRYTTVRRSVEKKKKLKLATIKEITLSSDYPDMVWAGVGKEYTYRLTIDGKYYDVAAVSGLMVRFKVPTLTPGKYPYRVEVLHKGEKAYTPKKFGKIIWQNPEQERTIAARLLQIEKESPGDTLSQAIYMDDKGLVVSALDLYTKYFKVNADDTDMYPMLIKAYHDLKLAKMKKAGALKLQDMLKDEEEG